jgi:hypothetical protein
MQVKITHHYVRVLLNSERIVKDRYSGMHMPVDSVLLACCKALPSPLAHGCSNDRALLKNLGCWLGLLTFAKSKPLLSKELDVKQVL